MKEAKIKSCLLEQGNHHCMASGVGVVANYDLKSIWKVLWCILRCYNIYIEGLRTTMNISLGCATIGWRPEPRISQLRCCMDNYKV